MYLALNGLDHGYDDPRWGGYRQIQEAGGHVRKGEKGTPIMYVEWRARRTARAEQGNPVRDEEGRPKLEWQKRDRTAGQAPLRLQRRADRGLQLRSLETAGPEWEGHERAEAPTKSSGVRVDHVAGDRAYYNLKDDRVVLPERSQFASLDAYTQTALHELGHATGHPSRLNRPTVVDPVASGTETYAREELRAEVVAMMTGEQLRRRARAAARHRVRQLVDQGAGERPEGDPGGGRRRAADLGLADLPRARAEPGRREGGAPSGRRAPPFGGGAPGITGGATPLRPLLP